MRLTLDALDCKPLTYIRYGAFAAALLTLSPAAHAQVEITPPASAVSASTNDGNLPGNAVDNNLTTRWSGNGDGAWLQLDLGAVRSVGSVNLAFFNGNLRRSRFDLQVATAPGAWSNVLTNVESAGTTTADETFDFADVDARWVRYLGHGNSDPAKATWNSVSEISVFEGAAAPTPTPTSTPTPTPSPTSSPTPTSTFTPTPPDTAVKLAVAAVSASTNDGNLPANTIDGSLATRWSGNGDGAWVQYDLGAAQSIAHVRIAVYNGNGRQNRFDLQVGGSSTGPWTNVMTNALTSGTTTLLETHDFADVTARFVRYVGHMSNVGTFNSLTEVEIWGTACTDCPTPTPTSTATPAPTPTVTPTPPDGGACSRTINVATSAQLASAASGALPGDCILAANGTYSAFTISADGTAASPILIKSVNLGGAVIGSGIVRIHGARHVTMEGFRITSGGGSTTLDGESRSVIVSIDDSDNCRVTRCNFKPSGHGNGTGYVMLNGNSNNNRVDHNDFGPNTVDGVHYVWPLGNRVGRPTLSRSTWANGGGPFNPDMARDTRVDHNYFHDMASGTAECIVLGGLGMTGDYEDLRTVVEYNLFTNCDGDPELVSIKSSSNIIRYNTVRTSSGGFVSRAGNKNEIYGNFSLQGGKGHGIRIHEMDHVVYNNYIELTSDYPLNIASGHSYSDSSFTHAQVKRAKVAHNTIVAINTRPVIFGWGNSGTRTLPPTDSVFANNILQGSATLTAFPNPGNMVFSNNVYSGTLGATRPQSEFWGTNPMLARVGELLKLTSGSPAIGYANPTFYAFIGDDLDGQVRSDPDAGADEIATGGILRRPLTSADVGPSAP
jgi:poly(beta-D-mannuronate) lyase